MHLSFSKKAERGRHFPESNLDQFLKDRRELILIKLYTPKAPGYSACDFPVSRDYHLPACPASAATSSSTGPLSLTNSSPPDLLRLEEPRKATDGIRNIAIAIPVPFPDNKKLFMASTLLLTYTIRGIATLLLNRRIPSAGAG